MVYSLCSLKGILPHRDYDCWLLFVKAVSIICHRNITLSEVERGDELLLSFCETFESLYGKEHCTINMHLHAHLADCICDFGPVYSFWLFSFERLNGILGSYHTNCHDISLQLMRRFTSVTFYSIHNWPVEYKEELYPLISEHYYSDGSLQSVSFELVMQECKVDNVKELPPVHELGWELHQKNSLQQLDAVNFGHNAELLTLYDKASAISIDGFVLGSAKSRFVTKSHVMANHPNDNQLHFARIDNFAKINVKSGHTSVPLWVVCVSFYCEHQCKVWFGGPTQVWCKSTTFDHFFITLSSIKS